MMVKKLVVSVCDFARIKRANPNTAANKTKPAKLVHLTI